MHHSWCYLLEPKDYFVESAMQGQYVIMHSIGVVVFGYLVQKASSAAVEQTTAEKNKTN